MTDEPLDIDCPFPGAVNPHVSFAREHLASWVRNLGLVRETPALRRFDRADFAWFAAVVHPSADARRCALVAQWFAWLFLIDDQLDDGVFGTDLTAGRKMRQEMSAVLRGAEPDSPALVALADLWTRTSAGTSAAWRARFAGHLDECLRQATEWEAANRVRQVVPDERTYIRNRRHTGAIYVCMDLIEIVEGVELAPEVVASADFAAALDAACNVVCWTNDFYSLEKERAHGEVHNLVYLVEHHRRWPSSAARQHVRAETAAETARYVRHERELLHRRPAHAAVLTRVTAGMRSWITGNNLWSRRTHRYTAEALRSPENYLEATLLGNGS
ncbi:terpene synthase family protein [Paractinoplanes rishiriensis]|uniref:Terpene synthase n=1 Tax=Paractinoplanes rishiriensis TaxID=1050105 RepID=A0A919JV81_9ACTN|nr:terpene cyclase [Actinoplanes rishiriensis]GIE95445.1 hypothetical protein Ari01nite_29100 [Actinoplanes rishiriensis]